MSSRSAIRVVLELAEEFLERYRQGERPALKEYIDRHPELADEIREVFPAMAMMENIALADESLDGDPTGDGAGQPEAAPLEQLGDYRIIREVGRGGMGVVYEAEQVSLGRHVALKVLPPQMLRDAKQPPRFEREAQAAAQLHHTNIVPVFGVGEHDETPYYVMQFIQGQGLDAVLEELKRLPAGGRPTRATAGADASPRGAATSSAADVARSLLTGRFDAGRDAAPNRPTTARPPTTESADVAASHADSGRSAGLAARSSHRPRRRCSARPTSDAAGQGEAADLLAERGPDRRPGGRCPGLRPQAGHPAPRHQAVEPAARHPRHRLGDRLRPGQGRRPAEPDPHRRHPGHAPLHAAGGVRGQVRRRGATSTRWA